MHESNSWTATIVLAEDDGKVTVLEPLIRPEDVGTPEEQQAYLDYLKRMREYYRRPRPIIPPPEQRSSEEPPNPAPEKPSDK